MTRKRHIELVRDEDDREVSPVEKRGGGGGGGGGNGGGGECIGQRDLIENLRVSVHAAKQGGWSLDHFLFAGPPGLGKTTLAHVIANELGVNLHVSSGPAIDHNGMVE